MSNIAQHVKETAFRLAFSEAPKTGFCRVEAHFVSNIAQHVTQTQ